MRKSPWFVAVLVLSAALARCHRQHVVEAPSSLAPVAGYSRDAFHVWADFDHNCRNTRQEILVQRSAAPVKFRHSKRGDCTVESGKWRDFYYDETLTVAQDADIDHVVPLKHAWDTGASAWDSAKREQFGNDPENLVVTNLKYNRQKGAKSITEWLPIDRAYACRYAAAWFHVKEKYGLAIARDERDTRDRLKCDEAAKIRE